MTDKCERLNEKTIRIVRLFPGPIERVWGFLTESEKRAQWLCAGDWDLRPGGTARMAFKNSELCHLDDLPPERYADDSDETYYDSMIKAVDAPHRLVLLWVEHDGSRSEVTFELETVGDKVRLTLTHTDIVSEDILTGVSSGWHAHLDIWLAVAEGHEPPSFWGHFNRLAKDVYAHRIDVQA
ncbi:MAG: SRPBCC family protein [Pseudomonadota bacterium]